MEDKETQTAAENTNTGGGVAKSSSPRAIRTLESDIAEYVKGKNVSLLDIVAEEAKSKGVSFEEQTKSSLPVKKILVSFLVVLVLAGGGYFAFTKISSEKNQSGRKAGARSVVDPIILDDETEILAEEGKKEVFQRELRQFFEEGGNEGDAAAAVIMKVSGSNEARMGRREFAGFADVSFPKELSDYLEDDFMVLRIEADGSRPALVFKAKSYNYVFSQMLKWENSLAKDLGFFFSGAALYSSGRFSDKYVKNHDARVLADDGGNTILVYSFVDRKYLVITENEDALEEVFRRFSSPQYVNNGATW
ncbi:MAG: hypothetical protein L6Q29_02745 [Candidatus Pacebacteria bacterium]|nr:hypothetical protein [Candidatus Paceibacterota bacterium]